MWFLTKIITKDYDNLNAYQLSFFFNNTIESLESLVFKCKETGETRLIPFDTCKEQFLSVGDVTQYINSRLDNDIVVGIYDDYLYCINKYELKIADYFEEAGVVKRVNPVHSFYASTVEDADKNLVILGYNNTVISVMRLLLTKPDSFTFESDAFYYGLDDLDLAVKYTYSLGKDAFDIALTKCRIAGKYNKMK